MQIVGQIHDRSFPIHIGADSLRQIPDLIPEIRTANRIVIVTDREVGSLYLSRLQQALQAAGLSYNVVTVDGAETGKNLDTVRYICEELADLAVNPSDILIAFGGGSIIDVAGYVTATFLGHPRLLLVPTSLFAMVDSAICPYNHLNVRSSKNSLGLANQPTAVVVDPSMTSSLSPRQIACGYARIVLYGLLADESLLNHLENGKWDLAELITLSLQAKQSLLNQDERLLSFGQQIGDSIEGHFRFLKYLHGEALALGMLSVWQDERLKRLLLNLKLPVELTGVSPEVIAQRILRTITPGEPLKLVELDGINQPKVSLFPSDQAESALLARIRTLSPEREATP
jgi:3-dehydroquinate synthase